MTPRYLKAMLLLVLGAMSLVAGGCAHSKSRVGGEETSKTGTLMGKVMDENHRGIENVRVAVSGIAAEVLTHADGSFLFARVTPGSYTVQARATGYVSSSRAGVLVDIGRATFVELELKEVAVRLLRSNLEDPARPSGNGTGTVRGMVTDENGGAVAYANVTVTDTQSGMLTDANGRFLIQGVPVGTHTVRVKLIGFVSMARESVQVSEGDSTTVDFKLKQATVKMREIEQRAEPTR
ncbi:MAG TPA: carboxypeptidase-like regulatory domain-containing protein [Candidatus Eisenbacteria bacterium]|nr:carboxypeptidase-like regulatory domain-containing protein [Candidatus Eisenbacteria bacterium]